MKLFNKIFAKLSGDATDPETENTTKEATDNAIDRRENAVKAIVKSLSGAIGSKSAKLHNMNIWVIVPEEDYEPTDFAWADDVFKSDLRLALDNAMLETIGRKKLQINFITSDKLPHNSISVIADELYYNWESEKEPVKSAKESNITPAEAWIAVEEGTGSLLESPVYMSAKEKTSYKIGRGVSARKYGRMRINDIIINDAESDSVLSEMNKYVSSAQAEIIIENNAFYIKASEGGCRASGGVATKIYRNDKCTELRDTDSLIPLRDKDHIELGKHVVLIFSTEKQQ
ncbi:MAG: hypothetical protein E7082_02750 [Bacteroidales bacterium]|nr:hypothetical protein [Bacteroidales bacterium]